MVVRYSHKTEVLWAEGNGPPTLVTDAHKDQVGRRDRIHIVCYWENPHSDVMIPCSDRSLARPCATFT